MAFDLSSAREAGYSNDELVEFLSAGTGFDVDAAKKSGYSKKEILDHLSKLTTRDDSDDSSISIESSDESSNDDENVPDELPVAVDEPSNPDPDTGSDIPPRYFKNVKVDHQVWIEDEGKSETHKVSAKDALASIKDDLENYKKLLHCMKG